MPKKRSSVLVGAQLLCWLAACSSQSNPANPAGTSGGAGTAAQSAGSVAQTAGTLAQTAGATGPVAGQTGVAGSAGTSAANGGSGGMSSVTSGSGGTSAGGAGAGGAGAAASAGHGGSAGGAGTAGSPAAGSGGSGAFALTSPVVKEGEIIPADYRCAKPSPALNWTAGPAGTMSYAIVLKDTTPGITMGTMHWTIYDIPASVTSLPMGVPSGAMLSAPAGAKQGRNYQSNNAFTGPCGGMNTYRFTLYALSVASLPGLSASSTGAQVETAAEGASKLATATLNIKSMP